MIRSLMGLFPLCNGVLIMLRAYKANPIGQWSSILVTMMQFLSSQFTTVAILNSVDSKLVNPTFVQWGLNIHLGNDWIVFANEIERNFIDCGHFSIGTF